MRFKKHVFLKLHEFLHEFQVFYNVLSQKDSLGLKVVLWLLTILTNFTWALGVAPMVKAGETSLTTLLWRLISAYSMMQAMSI